MKTVLFACVHNAGRSQMAAAWFDALADGAKARAVSAGTEPGARVHPEVVVAMREVGLDLAGVVPQKLTGELAAAASLLVTMGCGEACPVVPGLARMDWPLDDPKGKPLERVRAIRDEVRARVAELVAHEGWGRGRAVTYVARRARAADAERVAAIYDEGIEDRVATFETRLRTADDVRPRLEDAQYPAVVVEHGGRVIAFAWSSPTSTRECYRRNAEFSVYVAREARGRGAGAAAMRALVAEARAAGLHKLTSGVFPENARSRGMLRALGFREVGTYARHGQLDGVWRDVVIVERLLEDGEGEDAR